MAQMITTGDRLRQLTEPVRERRKVQKCTLLEVSHTRVHYYMKKNYYRPNLYGADIILEAVADTIVTTIQSEYCKWSNLLRNAFDHQRLAYNRIFLSRRKLKRCNHSELNLLFAHWLSPSLPMMSRSRRWS